MKLLFLIILICFSCKVQHSGEPVNGKFKYKGIEREYIFYAPKNIKAKAPLVIVLHGFTSSALTIMNYSDMNKLADEYNFAVLYPQGSLDQENKTFWNVGYDFHRDNKTDDVGFIISLAQNIQEKYLLSRQNTFVTGMSNGADMTYLLACTRPGFFKAMAPIAGTMMKKNMVDCKSNAAIPVFAVAGTSDKTTLYAGDMQNKDGWGAYLSIPDVIDFWATAIGYDKLLEYNIPDVWKEDSSTVKVFSYKNVGKNLEVLFYKVINGGHDWPGSSGNKDFNTSKEIWHFFEKFL